METERKVLKYQEEMLKANPYREAYIQSLDKLLTEKRSEADKQRADYRKDIYKNREKYRKEFKEMLGWPLTERNLEIPSVSRELLSIEEGVNIYRMHFQMPYGIKFFGLFFEATTVQKAPLIIAQHGGLGTPELASGFWDKNSSNYNDMITRTLSHGVHVFAPQLLLWDEKQLSLKRNRQEIDASLKQLGSSIAAVEVFCITKVIDYMQTLSCVDKDKIGMLGLSYGGFYTLYAAAADTRIKVALTCSQYNNRYKYGWSDWTWKNSAWQFLDNEICMLVSPRHLFIEVGDKDELFDSEEAVKEFNQLTKDGQEGNFHFRVFNGTHEFYKGNEDLEEFMRILKN